jgi:mono/diheme cytochrome c family protein
MFDAPRSADRAPAPIAGGTLRALSDGHTAVAAEPDLDRVFVVDYRTREVADVALQSGDEPGRVVEDDRGRVHVALRRGGAIVTLERGPWRLVGRRAVCSAPRGLAFDRGARLLHVACAEGQLVSLPPEPDAAPTRRVSLDRDLRDVVVDGDVVRVSRFRSAEVVTLDRDGAVVRRERPQPRAAMRTVHNRVDGQDRFESAPGTMTPAVAWRLVEGRAPGTALLLHQRGLAEEVSEQPGGYGDSPCGGIVETTISEVGPAAQTFAARPLPMMALAVDLALSRDGRTVVVVAPGNTRIPGLPQVASFDAAPARAADGECFSKPFGDPTVGPATRAPDTAAPPFDPTSDELPPPSDMKAPNGQAIAVAIDGRGHVLVQTREPPSVQVLTWPVSPRNIALGPSSPVDTGHQIFHANSGSGLACASCHPEGGDDGRVWLFRDKDDKLQPRRTQNLRGGILATAPFHWNGDLRDMGSLMTEVFVGRMGGPKLPSEHVDVLGRWVDRIPALPALPARDAAAAERGRVLFAAADCKRCHAGDLLTDNMTTDVGTGAALQVPSLRGAIWRAPYMHDGCAPTLRDRFGGRCGGGDKHGLTAKLTPAQIDDLVAFMETL